MNLARAVVFLSALAVFGAACVQAGPAANPTATTATVPPATPLPPTATETSARPDLQSPAVDVRPPMTPWEKELASLQPDGSRPLDSALRLFAMAFGPIPGIDVPADPGPIVDADPALRVVSAHLADLSGEQRAAVEAALAVPADAPSIEVAPAATSDLSRMQAGMLVFPPPQGLIDQVHETVRQLRDRLATKFTDFPGSMAVVFLQSESNVLSYYQPIYAGGQNFRCNLFVTETGMDAGEEVLRFSLAHDLFHCAQAFLTQDPISVSAMPGWVWQGQARYFAHDTSFGIGGEGDPAYFDYMLTPDIPLFQRGPDAAGFWGHVQYSLGGVAYDLMKVALEDGTNADRFHRIGADTPPFAHTWASGLVRFGGLWSKAWDTDAPNMASTLTPPRTGIQLLTGDVEIVDQQAYSNHVYYVETSADLLRFEFEGHARLGDGTIDEPGLASAVFCLRDDGCPPCPDDPDALTYPKLKKVSLLAVSGGVDGTHGTVSAAKLEPCKSPDVCQDGGTTAVDAHVAMVGGGTRLAQATPCPTPEPTPDEFCKRWRALLDWQVQNQASELTQPWAAEIARQSQAMLPYAPASLVDDVTVYIRVYGTYASTPEPMNVPIVGPDAALIGIAFMAKNAHCGITF